MTLTNPPIFFLRHHMNCDQYGKETDNNNENAVRKLCSMSSHKLQLTYFNAVDSGV